MAKKGKYFPYKNYLYLLIGIVVLLLLGWYIASWLKVKNEEKLSTSYLVKTSTITYTIDDLKEVDSVLQESPSEYFVYISYTGNEDIYKLEKKLKKIIDDYHLEDEFYYLDITSAKDKKETLDKLNKMFNTDEITNYPCIIYFRDGNIEKVIVDKNDVFDYNKFINLLKDNAFEKAS